MDVLNRCLDYLFHLINSGVLLFVHSYIGGFMAILYGVLKIRNQMKIKTKNVDWSSPLQEYLSGWIGGIGLLITGIIIIVFKIEGKL